MTAPNPAPPTVPGTPGTPGKAVPAKKVERPPLGPLLLAAGLAFTAFELLLYLWGWWLWFCVINGVLLLVAIVVALLRLRVLRRLRRGGVAGARPGVSQGGRLRQALRRATGRGATGATRSAGAATGGATGRGGLLRRAAARLRGGATTDAGRRGGATGRGGTGPGGGRASWWRRATGRGGTGRGAGGTGSGSRNRSWRRAASGATKAAKKVGGAGMRAARKFNAASKAPPKKSTWSAPPQHPGPQTQTRRPQPRPTKKTPPPAARPREEWQGEGRPTAPSSPPARPGSARREPTMPTASAEEHSPRHNAEGASLLGYGKKIKVSIAPLEAAASAWGVFATQGETEQPLDKAVKAQVRQVQRYLRLAAQAAGEASELFQRRHEADIERYENPRGGSTHIEERADVRRAREDM